MCNTHFLTLDRVAAAVVAAVLLICSACSHSGESNNDSAVSRDSAAVISSDSTQSIFHADNDIAMVVRSLCDAVSVGEPFDSATYTFSGVLTDGVGAPLYIDTRRNPGMWQVEVVSPKEAHIYNLDDGDLVSADLAGYISGCLGLTDEDLVTDRRTPRGEERKYIIHNGRLTFVGKGDTGLNGCHIVIEIDAGK